MQLTLRGQRVDIGDHLLYSHDPYVSFRCDIVRRN